MNPKYLILAALTGIFFLDSSWARNSGTIDFSKGSGQVDFYAIGNPSALKIHGQDETIGGVIHVVDGWASGVITLKLAGLHTGIEMRDEHMKMKYLEVDKYPDAKLEISKLDVTAFSKDGIKKNIPFVGKLFLHGTSHDISGTAKIYRNGAKVSVEGRFSTRISYYKIAVPSFAGITVADEVKVEADLNGAVVTN